MPTGRQTNYAERLIFTHPLRLQENDTTMSDETTALREQVAQQQQQLVALTLESAVKEGRILPAAREMFFRRHGEGGSLKDAHEWIATSPRPAERFQRHSSAATFGTDAAEPVGGPDKRLLQMTRQHIQKHFELTGGRERLDFGQAAATVARENRDLLENWRVMNGEM